jgi:UDP-N-acetylmuramate dehydrogenase
LHAGCFFKNPSSENPAGKVIDQMGLRGKKIGGAMVSEMHANFIVNTGTATSGDVVKLANHMRTKALRVGIDLQPEVELMGKHWEDVFRV